MASKVPGTILKSAQRSYGAVAAAASSSKAGGIEVTQLQSGAVVASLENHSPLTRVSVFFRGGSSANNFPGAVTAFKNCVTEGYSTPNNTGLHLIRLGESCGISLDMKSDKELLCYQGSCNRDNIHHLFTILADLTSNDQYRPYECPVPVGWPESLHHGPRSHDRLKAVQAAFSGEWHAKNMIFKAAFRSQPLGNTDVVPEFMYDELSAELVNEFVHNSHGSSGAVVVGTGIDHDMLLEGASTFGVSGGQVIQPQDASSKYMGGDARLDAPGDNAHVIIAGQAPGFSNAAGRMAALVAAELLSNAVSTHNGVAIGPMQAAAPGLALEGFSHNYKLAGLLGVSFCAPGAAAGQVSSSIAKFLKGYKPSEEEVATAKACLKSKIAMATGACEALALGTQLAQAGDVLDDVAAVSKVTSAAVSQVLSAAFGGKLSVAAYGKINNVPYSDTL